MTAPPSLGAWTTSWLLRRSAARLAKMCAGCFAALFLAEMVLQAVVVLLQAGLVVAATAGAWSSSRWHKSNCMLTPANSPLPLPWCS